MKNKSIKITKPKQNNKIKQIINKVKQLEKNLRDFQFFTETVGGY